MSDKNDNNEENIIETKIGDAVLLTDGEYVGTTAKVINVYNNSVSVEVDVKDKEGMNKRTVVKHSEYTLTDKE